MYILRVAGIVEHIDAVKSQRKYDNNNIIVHSTTLFMACN